MSRNQEPRIQDNDPALQKALLEEKKMAVYTPPSEVEREQPESDKPGWLRRAVVIGTSATAFVGTVAAFGEMASHHSEKAVTVGAPAHPGEQHHAKAETDPAKWTDETAPIQLYDREFIGVDAAAKAIKERLAEAKTPTEKRDAELETLNSWLNSDSNPEVQKRDAGYESKATGFTGVDGVIADFDTEALGMGLADRSDASSNNFINGMRDLKQAISGVNGYYHVSAERGAKPYRLEYRADTSKTADGTGLTIVDASTAIWNVRLENNYKEAGFTAKDELTHSDLTATDTWTVTSGPDGRITHIVSPNQPWG